MDVSVFNFPIFTQQTQSVKEDLEISEKLQIDKLDFSPEWESPLVTRIYLFHSNEELRG